MFAFTSFQHGQDHRTNGGLRTFQVHGVTYHLQFPLRAPDQPDVLPRFAQTWIYDGAMALNARTQRNANLDADIIRQLTEMLLHANPFIQLYRTAHERTQQNPHLAVHLDSDMNLIFDDAQHDRRRYNLPASTEIAAVIPDNNVQGARTARPICLSLRYPNDDEDHQRATERIDYTHPAYIPLHFVLLLPPGDRGWSRDLVLQNVDGQ